MVSGRSTDAEIKTAVHGGVPPADEVDNLKRFVQGGKEYPWSSSWRMPTGYLTDYNNNRPIQTSKRSLPL